MDHERTAAQPDPPRPKSATPKGSGLRAFLNFFAYVIPLALLIYLVWLAGPYDAGGSGEFGYFIGRVLLPIALAAGGLWVFRRWNPDLEIWSPWLFVGGVLIQLITMLPDTLS